MNKVYLVYLNTEEFSEYCSQLVHIFSDPQKAERKRREIESKYLHPASPIPNKTDDEIRDMYYGLSLDKIPEGLEDEVDKYLDLLDYVTFYSCTVEEFKVE